MKEDDPLQLETGHLSPFRQTSGRSRQSRRTIVTGSHARQQWAKWSEHRRIQKLERDMLVSEWLGDRPGRLAIGYASFSGVELDIDHYRSDRSLILMDIKSRSGAPHARTRGFALVDANSNYCECWVAVDEPEYRTIYHDYLTIFFGLHSDEKLSGKFHVDHVLSRARARQIFGANSQSFVRVAIVRDKINTSFGLFEKFAQLKDFSVSAKFGKANFSWPLIIKILELEPPSVSYFADEYIIRTLRKLHADNRIPWDVLETPYSVTRASFMSGSTGRTVDNSLVYRSMDGRVLTGDETVGVWLLEFDPAAEPERIELGFVHLPDETFGAD